MSQVQIFSANKRWQLPHGIQIMFADESQWASFHFTNVLAGFFFVCVQNGNQKSGSTKATTHESDYFGCREQNIIIIIIITSENIVC